MTDRDLIARALLSKVTSARVKWRTYDEEADAMIAALAAAGRVIVDQGAIAAARDAGRVEGIASGQRLEADLYAKITRLEAAIAAAESRGIERAAAVDHSVHVRAARPAQ